MIAIALFVVGCEKSAADSQQPPSAPEARRSPQTTPTPSASAQPREILMSDVFTREESLSYSGFDVAKIAKRSKSKPTDLSYAVIKRKGKVTAKFDNSQEEGVNSIDFGLFPLLGGKTKQLIVSQTRPGGGRHIQKRSSN